MKVEILSPQCVARFASKRHHWHLFLLEADPTKVRDFPAATQFLNQLHHRLAHGQHPYVQNFTM
jgi:hypothetical protein